MKSDGLGHSIPVPFAQLSQGAKEQLLLANAGPAQAGREGLGTGNRTERQA